MASGKIHLITLPTQTQSYLNFSDDTDATDEIPQIFTHTQQISKRVASYASSANSDDVGDNFENGFKTERESPPPQPPVMAVTMPPSVDLKKERPPKEDIQNKLNKSCSVCQVCRGMTAVVLQYCSEL